MFHLVFFLTTFFEMSFVLESDVLTVEVAIQKHCWERVFWKYTANLQENSNPKCHFNKVANRTSACVFSCKFTAYFQDTFSTEYLWMAASITVLCPLVIWKFDILNILEIVVILTECSLWFYKTNITRDISLRLLQTFHANYFILSEKKNSFWENLRAWEFKEIYFPKNRFCDDFYWVYLRLKNYLKTV